jgi:putative transposase
MHIVQRGNNRSACFFSDPDRRFYLKCLAEASVARGCQVHAYVLMSNHVHLLITPVRPGAASAMLQDVGRRYVRTINSIHERTGTLWEGRFKSSLIDSERYLFACHRYIELNPVRAGIVSRPGDYSWSSNAHYAHGASNKVLTPHRLFNELGTDALSRMATFRAMFGDADPEEDLARLRIAANKGWALGSDGFLDALERHLGRSIRPPRRGRPGKDRVDADDPAGDQREMLF